jgi:hypothetical protein
MDESKPSYQQLASATERWANFVMEAVQPYKTSFKRAAADLFEADPITELFTIIHVTLVFDTKHNRDFEIPDSEVLKEIFLDQGDLHKTLIWFNAGQSWHHLILIDCWLFATRLQRVSLSVVLRPERPPINQ